MNKRLLGAIFAVLSLPGMSSALAGPCTTVRAKTWYNVITAGDYRLMFDDHNPPGPHGLAFVSDQPFKIVSRNGKSCSTGDEVSIVTMPIYIVAGKYLYISTYGGSDGYVFAVDARNCRTLWQSPDTGPGDSMPTATGFILPGIGWLVLGPDCLPETIIRAPAAVNHVPNAKN